MFATFTVLSTQVCLNHTQWYTDYGESKYAAVSKY